MNKGRFVQPKVDGVAFFIELKLTGVKYTVPGIPPHLAGNTTIFQELDSWLRRKLRAILWRQWKRSYTRAKNLIKLGFSYEAAWRFVKVHRGPWATAGTFNMHRLLKNSYFDSLGLVSLQDQYQRLQRVS